MRGLTSIIHQRLLRCKSFPSSANIRSFSLKNQNDDYSVQRFTLITHYLNYYKLFFNTASIERAKDLENRVSGRIFGRYLATDLEHGLLKKYNFDIYDFYNGSKDASNEFISAVFAEDMSDYALNKIEKTDNISFLLDNLSPITFMKVVSMNLPKTIDGKKFLFKRKASEPSRFEVFRVITYMQIPTQDEYYLDSPFYRLFRYFNALLGYKDRRIDFDNNNYVNNKIELGRNYFDETVISQWFEDYYPRGSVNAGAYVGFDINVETEMFEEVTSESGEKTWKFVMKESEKKKCVLTYLGCISGQRELEWKIVRFMYRNSFNSKSKLPRSIV